MPTFTFPCPHCNTVLTSANARAGDRHVTCLMCHMPVPVPSSMAAPPPGDRLKNRVMLGICLVLGGLVFLGGGIALAIVLSSGDTPPMVAGHNLSDLDKQALASLQQKNNPGILDPDESSDPPPAKTKPVPGAPQPLAAPLPPVFQVSSPVAAVPVPPAGVEQKRIDAAIDKGVNYLKAHQNLNGTWGGGAIYAVGYTALPGLTLLECGVSPKDPVVQKAAAFVRNRIPKLAATYELSLAILFLDRLGEQRDKLLIRSMALKLVAGQTAAGGWNYFVPLLPPSELDQLFIFLEKTRPKTPFLDPLAGDKPGMYPLTGKDPRYPNPLGISKDREGYQPLTRKGEIPLPMPIPGARGSPDDPVRKGEPKKIPDNPKVGAGAIAPFDPDEKNPAADKTDKPWEPKAGEPKPAAPAQKAPPKVAPKGQALRPDFLPPNLQNIPAVINQGKAKGKAILRAGRDDNSNSQFAMLALWTARRHGVPTDMTLMLAYQRYLASQTLEGGWGYMSAQAEQTPSMTCVGLLGLAMGHGSAPTLPQANGPKLAGKTITEDPAIQDGLKALGRYIGEPSPSDTATPPMENLYFLWSVERVAMLYNLKTIGGKDWYGWGAQILVPNQRWEGSWRSNLYHGSAPTIDTCFALLFLKRSNLVQDLTENLQLYMAITDPDAHKK